MSNKIVLKRGFFYMVAFWLVSSTLLGFLFGLQEVDAPYVTKRYAWVGGYIENYSKFSWAMFFLLMELPVLLLLSCRYGVSRVAISGKAIVAFVAVVISSLLGLLGMIEPKGGNAFSRFVRVLMVEFDWLGALLFFMLLAYSFWASLLVLINSKGRSEKNV